ELGSISGTTAPAMVHARGHRRVHQVIDASDPVEHRPHLDGEVAGLAIGKLSLRGSHHGTVSLPETDLRRPGYFSDARKSATSFSFFRPRPWNEGMMPGPATSERRIAL